MKEFKVAGIDLDELDKRIILLTQEGLEVCARPYLKLAHELNISEEEVCSRLKKMSAVGFIRKNAIATNHYKLGFTFNAMTVWDVYEQSLDSVGLIFKELGFVSHCYERPVIRPDWNFNLFAMVHGKSEIEITDKVEKMKTSILGKYNNMDLIYSTKILKKTGIRLKGNKNV